MFYPKNYCYANKTTIFFKGWPVCAEFLFCRYNYGIL